MRGGKKANFCKLGINTDEKYNRAQTQRRKSQLIIEKYVLQMRLLASAPTQENIGDGNFKRDRFADNLWKN